jgi:hypothetical protein
MNSNIFPHIWRFVVLVAVQSFVLQQMTLAIGPYFVVLLWPLFIVFLPLALAPPYLVLLGFAAGMAVDLFYGTPGVHASAGAFMGFIRPFVLAAFAPKGGFSGKEPIFAPAHVGWQTFLQGIAVLFVLHIFWYFSVEAFTFVYIGTTTLKTISTWSLTMVFAVLYTTLFNPKI